MCTEKIGLFFIIILEVLAFYLPDSVKAPLIHDPKTDVSLSLEIYAQILSSQFLIYFF